MTHLEYERVFLCQQCARYVIVGPCHEHIEPERFRCVQCRMAADPRAGELADVIANARKKQDSA